MPMKLPRLGEASCKCLTVCGRVEGSAKGSLQRLAQDKEMSARLRVAGGPAHMRLMLGGRSGRHLHVDCASTEYFPHGRTPQSTHKSKELLAVLERAVGWKIDVGVRGIFGLKLAELTENGVIRRIHAAEARAAGMSMKLTAGRFSVSGAPVRSIRWSVSPAGTEVDVDMVGERSMAIQESYLQDCLDWIRTQVDLFVLGRGAHERT